MSAARRSARTLKIRLGGRVVPVVFAPGGLGTLGARMRAAGLAPGACAVITDRTVDRLYGARVRAALRRGGFVPHAWLSVPPGERSKSLATAAVLYDHLAGAGLERGRPIVALGGGMVGDLAGFVAATWLRGVPLVHVPTTVLAQLDSSLGGKVGVDLAAGKNLVGAYHQPRLVLVDSRVLDTLPQRQVRAGLAEAVKVGFVLDRGLVSLLEAMGGYRRFLHGEAVAMGMLVAAAAAVRAGRLPEKVAERQRALLTALGLPGRLPAGIRSRNVLDHMRLDKKTVVGKPRFVLTTGVGVASFGEPLDRSEVIAALQDAGAE